MDAATGRLAEDGRGAAERAGATRCPAARRVALFCHSYGSVVCGVAARDLPSRVTDIAVAGSPGMRVENAAELHTRARVWAMRDADDWIQDVPHLEVGGLGHGADPVDAGVRRAGAVRGRRASGTPAISSRAPRACSNFAEIGVGAYARSVRCASDGSTRAAAVLSGDGRRPDARRAAQNSRLRAEGGRAGARRIR